MADAKRKKAALEKFLKTPREPSRKCETCAGDPEIVKAIEVFLAAQDSGKTSQSFAAFYRFLVEAYGYVYKETALFNHVRRCLRGLSRG